MKYYAKATVVPSEPGYANTNLVEVFNEKDEKVGEYSYNYSSFDRTFASFERDGKDYALISRRYTATTLIALPSMETVWTEESSVFGFCPIQFWAPPELLGRWAFMTGCVWGDDSTEKIQLIDLRDLTNVKITAKFGYCQIPRRVNIEDRVKVDAFDFENEHSFSVEILSTTEYTIDDKDESPEEKK